jgi:transcriptional antiterminator RfaH
MQALRPLFPGYLFVRLDPAKSRWRSINGTMGVSHILTDGEVPKYLDEAIVAEIMSREDATGAVKFDRPAFLSGQPVRVTDGPFADLGGLFEEVRDHERVVLLISLLGRKVRALVPAMAVEAA